MSKKRGLSVEEKRSRMLDFFYEKKDIFTLKELERLCQKEKGITSMSVKDVLQSLVDDVMVDTDKIGTSVYFWAFPSKASQVRKRKIQDLEQKLEGLEESRTEYCLKLKQAKVGREESSGRAELLQMLGCVRTERAGLEAELAAHRDCDPDVLRETEKEGSAARDAANRWTDNIFSVKTWIRNKMSFDDDIVNKQFGIDPDMDYIM